METKFTKGEWEIQWFNSDRVDIKAIDSNNKPVARLDAIYFDSTVTSFEELDANSKLIAAAPDLLKSLIKAEDFITRCLTLEGKLTKLEIEIIIGHAREAIKKATE